jgi:predicted ATPase/DNA-binding winged helix-turn-helix (wHTH) protein
LAEQELHLAPGLIAFGPFVLDLKNRCLSKGGHPVRVRDRELSLLIYLAERAGEFVTRDQLIAAIWSGSKVGEANVRVQMGALKRLLGDGRSDQAFVSFSTGKGYRFSCSQSLVDQPSALQLQSERGNYALVTQGSRQHNLPIRIKPFFGREEAFQRLKNHLPLHRLVTIVGPGGIGKTSLALAGAEALVDSYEDGIRLVDLAGLSDPQLISGTMAVTLNTSLLSPDPVDDLVKCVLHKQILIVLDNCEHLIEEIAAIVEKILTRTRDVHFLATSREPLRIDSEWLFRLGPLDVPPRQSALTARESLTYPAVKLFVERVRLSEDQFELVDSDVGAVADLCRRLDGNPLAVELAAARVGLFGVQGLAEQLAESFSTLTQGRRTALPRHQTLRATLDWSFDILSEREQMLLTRLSIFRGEFTLTSAQAVAGISSGDIVDGLAELTTKSLINVDSVHQPAQYRMLFLTRDYALEKLVTRGDFHVIARRHAETYLDLLQCYGNEISAHTADRWIDDIRSALDWTLSEAGDFNLGMDLITASFGTALRIASLHERGLLLDRATTRVRELGKSDPAFELRLLVERVSILNFGENKEAEMQAVAEKAMALAEKIQMDAGDFMPLAEMLITKISIYFGEGNAEEMRRHIHLARALPLPQDKRAATFIILERMEFQAEHFAGNQPLARSIIEKMLAYPSEVLRTRHFAIADYISPSVTSRIFLSRIHWLQGRSEQAAQTARDALELSQPLNALVICYVLAFCAIPVALWRGDYTEASAYIAQLEVTASASTLAYWETWVPYYETILNAGKNTDTDALVASLASMTLNSMQIDHLTTLAPYLSDEAAVRSGAGLSGWTAPEIHRLRGHARVAASDGPGAETLFLHALKLAKQQSALAWELRAAISLARLWMSGPRRLEAAQILADILVQFPEGQDDADQLIAIKLRDELSL